MRAVGGLALVLALVTGCGVSAEDSPRALSSAPPPITGPRPSATPTPTPLLTGPQETPVYFVREGGLVRVIRMTPVRPTAETLLAVLQAGPTAAENAKGTSSAVSDGLSVASGPDSSGPLRGTVTVEVSGDRNDAVLGFGQIVLTLSSARGVSRVLFVRDGQFLQLPRGDNSIGSGPFSRRDYEDLLVG